MRPKVVVALPAKCSSSVKDHIERGLREKHPSIDFDFKDDANIKCPQARGLEPNLGTKNVVAAMSLGHRGDTAFSPSESPCSLSESSSSDEPKDNRSLSGVNGIN